jgi:tetratricopeptide (TPR) repeat protein
MDRESIDAELTLGKEAARRGDDALAFRHLQRVVEAEPENESAWLWLSAVVADVEDKRLCLENVLTLNPESQPARRGLARLPAVNEEPPPAGELVQRPVEPLTPAGAILYPERRREGWRWHDPVRLQQKEVAGYSTQSTFDDVWQGVGELCAYCATELAPDETRCPGCGRELVETTFRYPRASNDLVIYWVLILGIGQLALVTVLFNLLSHGSPASLAWQTIVFLSMLPIAAALAFRRFWAYVASVVALLLILAAMILGPTLGPAVDNSLSQLVGRDFFVRLGENPYALFIGPASDILRIVQYLAVPMALLYALLRVGPDFERISARRVASLDRGISDSSHFHGAGAAYARDGMWATAVLHFQRAAALEPSNPFYQRQLGEAYAQLGFYQRCLDVLESASQLTRDPETRAATERRMAEIRQQMPAPGPELAETSND